MRAYRLALACLLIGVLWTARSQVAEFVRFVFSLRAG
jgi:hypothetical protein